MPFYDYYCPFNDTVVEVKHGTKERLHTWKEVCEHAGLDLGRTPANAEVQKLISAPGVATPTGNSRLKELGFTKLVKRDNGVYENVTASGSEKKIVKADDPSSMPQIKKKIKD